MVYFCQNCDNYYSKNRNVQFQCRRCKFTDISIKIVRNHTQLCIKKCQEEIQPVLERLREENKYYKLKCENLERELITEKTNCKLYRDMLENSIPEKKETVPETISKKEETISKKEEIVSEKKETIPKQEADIEKKRDDIRDHLSSYLGAHISKNENAERILLTFDKVKQSRNYTKLLENIRKYRQVMLRYGTLIDYCLILRNHIKRITEIFSSRGFNKNKISNILRQTFLHPWEMRIYQYPGYEKINIEVEGIQKVKESFLHREFDDTTYVPFIINSFQMCYYLALFTVKDCFYGFVKNSYGYNNIIYSGSTRNDPYAFYYLERIENNQIFWKMDCRLDYIATEFIERALRYCISTYRTIYQTIFQDNDYREEYNFDNQIFEIECEQLIQNIIILSDSAKSRKILQDIIIKNNTYSPKSQDKFNLKSDDILQKKSFLKFIQKNYTREIKQSLSQLFDNISPEQIDEFYKKKI
jgi:hypothetical protein